MSADWLVKHNAIHVKTCMSETTLIARETARHKSFLSDSEVQARSVLNLRPQLSKSVQSRDFMMKDISVINSRLHQRSPPAGSVEKRSRRDDMGVGSH